jgi:hypothetical protein
LRFAVQGPGCPVASPRSHGVPRRDVPGRVHISVANETAGRAGEPRLALTRCRIHVSARRTPLTAEGGLDLLHSARRLVLQSTYQQAPPGPQDLAIKSGLGADVPARSTSRTLSGPGHGLYPQVLDADHVELTCNVCTGLLHPVLAPVRLAGPQSGDSEAYLLAAIRSPAGPGELALQTSHVRALPHRQTGNVKHCPAGQCRRYCNATVDPNDLAVTRRANWKVKQRSLLGCPAGISTPRTP